MQKIYAPPSDGSETFGALAGSFPMLADTVYNFYPDEAVEIAYDSRTLAEGNHSPMRCQMAGAPAWGAVSQNEQAANL